MDLLRCEEAGIDKKTRQKMETILYTLAVKLLDGKTLEQVKEKFGMTLLGEMLYSDGEKKGLHEGVQKGELLKLISLIRKKTQKGFQENEISDLLEEDLSVVQKICQILKQQGSEASDEEVYLKYTEQKA